MEKENKENYCVLYLVRHGETEWNVKKITQGQSESILTENGIKQAKETSEKLKHIKFDAIFSSDLSRAHRTAEIIKLDREIVIQTSKMLRERAYGRFEKQHSDVFKEILKEKLIERETLSEEDSWNFRLDEEVETDEEIVSRFLIHLREIAVACPGKTVLVVSHGGPLRMFLVKTGYATKKELPGGSFKNGGYVKVLSDGVDFFIKEVEGITKPKGGE
ncbi:MAG: histidine phosphatase family protein [Minisyncoccia bacterium]